MPIRTIGRNPTDGTDRPTNESTAAAATVRNTTPSKMLRAHLSRTQMVAAAKIRIRRRRMAFATGIDPASLGLPPQIPNHAVLLSGIRLFVFGLDGALILIRCRSGL